MNTAKKVFLLLMIAAVEVISITSCNQGTDKSNTETDKSQGAKENDAASTKPGANTLKESTATAVTRFSLSPIVMNYLSLKNALVSDDGTKAAAAGKELLATLKGIDMNSIPSAKHKEFMDIVEDAKENAEHIGDNAGKISHQREHFASLSKDVNDLLALFSAPQKLYQDFCPMYDNGKGAIWLSETKEINNPYYGSKMATCGSVKKEY